MCQGYFAARGGCRQSGSRVRSALRLLTAWLMATTLLLPQVLPAQEKIVTLSFTRELLYTIARDNEGQMTEEIVARLKGLSPGITDVRIGRLGGEVTLACTAAAGDDLQVKFNFILEKMAFYRMAAAREDIDGMLKILEPSMSKEPLILAVGYRTKGPYSIVDLTLDLGSAVRGGHE